MSVEIAWKQNILVTDFHLLKSLLVVLGFGSQTFICGFSRQNINSVDPPNVLELPESPEHPGIPEPPGSFKLLGHPGLP